MADPVDTTGAKRYLARTKTIAELKAMAEQLVAAGVLTEEILITANSFEGSAWTGVPALPGLQLLNVIEEILSEAGEVPAIGGRQLMTFPSYAGQQFRF